ncbi:MAG TPA: low temperature requirement protein A [Sphingomonadaceae bacterium]
MPGERRSLLRDLAHGHAAVSYLELFLDLVFVFAITQLSHFLLEHLTPFGTIETLILFLAVWWAWIYTTWATNWVDPARGPVRFMVAGVMIGSLVLSSSLPFAFAYGGLVFALAYAAIQILRTCFVVWAMRADDKVNARNLARATLYFCLSAVFWVWGGLAAEPPLRAVLWAIALAIEYSGPALNFHFPWLGRAQTTDWSISGAHMAERCALFIIIALGEGIIVTGTEFGQVAAGPLETLAFVTAFAGSFAMWWVYFDLGAIRGAQHIARDADPGRIARDAFTYWHLPIVAGIVVLAVADEQVLAEPLAPSAHTFVILTGGGSALFLGGTMVFKRLTSGMPWMPASHYYGLWLTGALALGGWLTAPPHLVLANLQTAVFAAVAVWEWGSFHGGWLDKVERHFPLFGHAMRRRLARLRAKRIARGWVPPE